MIRLEHVNLVVKELEPTLKFILTAFPEWKIRGRGEMKWQKTTRNWLHVGTDDYYITLNDGAAGNMRDLSGMSPGLAHLGFVIENLDALIERLTVQGYQIDVMGADHPHRKTAYYVDPAGFQFEFLQYLSEIPAQRNLYGGETTTVKRIKKSA